MRKPDWTTREWVAFALMMLILAFVAANAMVYAYMSMTGCDNPGCNIPEVLSIDHYSIRNDASGRPSLLTVWFRSYGSAGQTVTLRSLYLINFTSQYQFQINGIIAANSLVPVSIDTSIDGFYLVRSEEHTSELQSHVNLVCR